MSDSAAESEIRPLLTSMWDTNQNLHDRVRELETELAIAATCLETAVARYEHLELALGHVVPLIDLAKLVVAVRDRKRRLEDTTDDMFRIVTEWEKNRK